MSGDWQSLLAIAIVISHAGAVAWVVHFFSFPDNDDICSNEAVQVLPPVPLRTPPFRSTPQMPNQGSPGRPELFASSAAAMVVQWSIFLVDGRRRLGGGWIGSSILLAITVINLVLFL